MNGQSQLNIGLDKVFQMRINVSNRRWLGCLALIALALPSWQHSVAAQGNSAWLTGHHGISNGTSGAATNVGSRTQFVPLGTRSLVDQYRSDRVGQISGGKAGAREYRDGKNSKRHLVRLQQNGFAAPPLPATGAAPMAFPDNGAMGFPSQPASPQPGFQEPIVGAPFGLPPSSVDPAMMSNPVNSPGVVAPPTGPPPALPTNPPISNNQPVASFPSTQTLPAQADMFPIARPQLNDGFATVGNSCCVSPPSNYVAAMGLGNCVGYQPTASQGYIATGPQTANPPQAASAVPSGLVPVTRPSARGVPKKPLINLGQDKNAVVVGQGLIGQPVAYVPGQCVRNWIRYIFP